MKKIVALTLALLMVIGLTAIVKPAAAEEVVTLKLWCIATESDANRPAYLQAIADYEAAHPNIKIEMEAFENESYKTKIKAAMMGGDTEDLPDIFFSWSRLPGRVRQRRQSRLPRRDLQGLCRQAPRVHAVHHHL